MITVLKRNLFFLVKACFMSVVPVFLRKNMKIQKILISPIKQLHINVYSLSSLNAP